MKRIFSIALALSVAAVLFSGCSSGSDSQDGQKSVRYSPDTTAYSADLESYETFAENEYLRLQVHPYNASILVLDKKTQAQFRSIP